MPFGRQTARKDDASWPSMRRDNPHDGTARPGKATRQESARHLQQRRNARGEHGVVTVGRKLNRLPAATYDARWLVEARKPRLHVGVRLDRSPLSAKDAQRPPKLAASSANVEKIANTRHKASNRRCQVLRVIGSIDCRRVDFDGIAYPRSGSR